MRAAMAAIGAAQKNGREKHRLHTMTTNTRTNDDGLGFL